MIYSMIHIDKHLNRKFAWIPFVFIHDLILCFMLCDQERLEKSKADLEMRKAAEKQEQALLRDREEKLVK